MGASPLLPPPANSPLSKIPLPCYRRPEGRNPSPSLLPTPRATHPLPPHMSFRRNAVKNLAPSPTIRLLNVFQTLPRLKRIIPQIDTQARYQIECGEPIPLPPPSFPKAPLLPHMSF